MMGVSIATVLFIYKKRAIAKAEVDMSEEGTAIRLLSSSPFYPSSGYKSSWDGVENVSTNFNPSTISVSICSASATSANPSLHWP